MKKHISIVVIGLLAIVLLFSYSIYKYNQKPKPGPSTVSIQKYNELAHNVQIHDAVNAQNAMQLQLKIDNLTRQRNALCAQAKTLRVVVDPSNCQ